MTPLERAARALCLDDGCYPDYAEGFLGSDGHWVDPGTPRWREYLPAVRAVLQAIREPSEGMLSAVIVEPTHLYDQGIRGVDYQRDMKLAVASDRLALAGRWKDLIDAALGESP